MKVFKYPIDLNDRDQIISVPGIHTSAVMVGNDPSGDLCVWIQFDPDRVSSSHHRIIVKATGEDSAHIAPIYHLGSVVRDHLVWHVYSPTLRKAP